MPTTTDHDPIDFTFEDDGDLVRRAPKAVPEDPIEARLQREREAAPFIARATGVDGLRIVNLQNQTDMAREYQRQVHASMGKRGPVAVEVKHGSGKVKV